MTDGGTTRRLTAIMITDIVGYSALMSADESRALGVLGRQRALLPTLIVSHGGVVHKEIGDRISHRLQAPHLSHHRPRGRS